MTPEQALAILDSIAKVALLNESDRNLHYQAVRNLADLIRKVNTDAPTYDRRDVN